MNPILGMLIMLELFAATSAIVLGVVYLARRQIDRHDNDGTSD